MFWLTWFCWHKHGWKYTQYAEPINSKSPLKQMESGIGWKVAVLNSDLSLGSCLPLLLMIGNISTDV